MPVGPLQAPSAPLPGALSSLEEAIAIVHSEVDALADRLAGITGPDLNLKDTKVTPVRPPSSGPVILARTLDTVQGVNAIGNRLRELRDRLVI